MIDLDDLAIRTDYFIFDDFRVQFKEDSDICGFFWSDAGGEFQFKTRILKNFKRPVVYSMLEHSDKLLAQKGRKVFSCDFDVEITADWVHQYGEQFLNFNICFIQYGEQFLDICSTTTSKCIFYNNL